MTNTNVVKLEASNGKVVGLIPRSLDEIYKLSETILKSGLAPQGTKSAEQVAVSILHGLEVGLPPLQAVQKVAVINQRPALWGDAVPALLWSKGFKIEERFEGEGDNLTAVCVVTRPCGTYKIERTFSVEDAKRARLWGRQGPWSQYPNRMLQMRARSFAARDGASEVLCGLYLAEEALDIPPPRDVTPTVVDIEKSEVVLEEYITSEQSTELARIINEEPVINLRKFFSHFKINSLQQLPKTKYDVALSMIADSKKRQLEVQ